jgi:hypothetical protein
VSKAYITINEHNKRSNFRAGSRKKTLSEQCLSASNYWYKKYEIFQNGGAKQRRKWKYIGHEQPKSANQMSQMLSCERQSFWKSSSVFSSKPIKPQTAKGIDEYYLKTHFFDVLKTIETHRNRLKIR